jgi:hypothetical protein
MKFWRGMWRIKRESCHKSVEFQGKRVIASVKCSRKVQKDKSQKPPTEFGKWKMKLSVTTDKFIDGGFRGGEGVKQDYAC